MLELMVTITVTGANSYLRKRLKIGKVGALGSSNPDPVHRDNVLLLVAEYIYVPSPYVGGDTVTQ